MMFGEIAQQERPDDLQPGATPVLEVQGLSRDDAFADVSFELYEAKSSALLGC